MRCVHCLEALIARVSVTTDCQQVNVSMPNPRDLERQNKFRIRFWPPCKDFRNITHEIRLYDLIRWQQQIWESKLVIKREINRPFKKQKWLEFETRIRDRHVERAVCLPAIHWPCIVNTTHGTRYWTKNIPFSERVYLLFLSHSDKKYLLFYFPPIFYPRNYIKNNNVQRVAWRVIVKVSFY